MNDVHFHKEEFQLQPGEKRAMEMNKKIPLMTIGIFILVIMTISAHAETGKAKSRPQVPEGWIAIEEDYLDPLEGEAQHHFLRAREDFFEKHMKTAAAEIRKAAVFLRIEAAGATQEGGEALKDSYDELESLAGRIEKGAVRSAADLDKAFFRAHHALAENYYYLASEYWGKKDVRKTGKHLHSLAESIERAVAWGGHKAEEGTYAAINEARILAGKMKEGAGWTEEEVDRGLEKLHAEIQKLGKEIETGK
jgi:hypothetical protein